MHGTRARTSPSDRRRLRYGYCTRGLGRSSRMRSAGLPFFRLRPAWPSPWAISVGPMHRGIQMHITTMTTEARRGTGAMRHDADATSVHISTGS